MAAPLTDAERAKLRKWQLSSPSVDTGPASIGSSSAPNNTVPTKLDLQRPKGLYPPASTGPANTPQGFLRDKVAGASYLSDDARRLMGQTPIRYDTTTNPEVDNPALLVGNGREYGHYNVGQGDISLHTWGEDPENAWPTLAHEFTHTWQDKRTPIWDNNQNAQQYAQQMVSDVNQLAKQPDSQFGPVLSGYNNITGAYDKDPVTTATEYGARLAAEVGAQGMPPWFRDRYYPGYYRPIQGQQ